MKIVLWVHAYVKTYKIILFKCMQFYSVSYTKFKGGKKKERKGKKNPPKSSHYHLNFILNLYCGPRALFLLAPAYLSHLIPHILSSLLPSPAAFSMASLLLPPSPFTHQSFSFAFFSWLALSLSAHHIYHSWDRSSGWPGPKRYHCTLFLSAI